MNLPFKKYDETKLSISKNQVHPILITYIHEELLPFPQSVDFKDNQQLLIYAKETDYISNIDMRKPLSIQTILEIIADISAQIMFCEKHQHTFVGFCLADIIQIQFHNENGKQRRSRYLILNDTYLVSTKMGYQKNELCVLFLSNVPQFCSIELEKKIQAKQFPIQIHAKTGYFAFGKMIQHFFKKNRPSQKIMGFLKRCMNLDEDSRVLLYL